VLSSTDRQLLGDLARQAGAAAHSVRVMSELQRSRERLIAAREEERLRLRRDLHDGLGPTLAALVFKIGLIRDSVRDDPDRSDRLLLELGGETKDAIADIRSLVYALRPPALDELGLVGALREQAALLSESTGVEIAVASPDLPQLPPAVEVAAYRIVTEALINVTRHAQANHCDVELRLGDSLDLDVSDDGIGFAEGARPGVGLRSMRERADELGGSFAAGRGAARGTRILVRLPVAP
jgi:signal transduction histidine kinase